MKQRVSVSAVASFRPTALLRRAGGVLWSELLKRGIKIHFAHRTFKWTNEPGKAAVYCVILGFGRSETERKRLFGYGEVDGEPHESPTKNINSYLVDSTDVLIARRATTHDRIPQVGVWGGPEFNFITMYLEA
jgi:hypothetical protein